MDKNLKVAHKDAALKGAAIGIAAYVAAKLGLGEEGVAVLVPVVAYGLSVLSTKVGDENTAMFLKLAEAAVKADKKKPAAKKEAPKK